MSKLDLFMQTITREVLEPGDYVDWNKINEKADELRKEIALLQSLKYSKEPAKDLAELLLQTPRVLDVLQLLVAHTPNQIWFSDGRHIHFKEDIDTLRHNGTQRASEIANIFLDMRLIEFLKSVESVRDCVRGVLVGLEPNSRKNRRGEKFDEVVNQLVENVVADVGKALDVTLGVKRQLRVDLRGESKTVDFAINMPGEKAPRAVIEVNFYSTSGSKPSETLSRAYPDVQRGLKEKGIGMIVLTDGEGWVSMKTAIETALNKLEHCYNLKQAKQGELKRALLEMLQR